MNIKKLKEMRKNKNGFTFIEIIVVVVILAVLMAVAVPSVLKYMGEADDAKYMSQARGAYIAAQAEITKEYVASTTKDTLEAKVDEMVSGTPKVSQVDVYMVKPTSVDKTGAEGGTKLTGSPENAVMYVVYFGADPSKPEAVATVEPNSSVQIYR